MKRSDVNPVFKLFCEMHAVGHGKNPAHRGEALAWLAALWIASQVSTDDDEAKTVEARKEALALHLATVQDMIPKMYAKYIEPKEGRRRAMRQRLN
jgi:hypothetical protein